MNRGTPVIGVLGAVLGVGGMIAYTLAPQALWIVTLVEGVALMCLTWFFVAHFETLKAFSVKRSTRLGANSILIVLLFLGILGIVNFLAARHSVRWDLSESRRFTLAPQTYEVLKTLSRDVHVTVFAVNGSPAHHQYQDLLGTYSHASPWLRVDYVDPEKEPSVARKYGITRINTAVVESGPHSTQLTFPSELELTAALIRVSKDTPKRILFLDGHGERDVDSEEREGYSKVQDTLSKQGYEVETVTLLAEFAVPDNTSVLVVAGPQRQVTQEEKELIADYVVRGGRLLIMIDPDRDGGLHDLLIRWGTTPGQGTLVDLQDKTAQGDLTSLMVRTFTEHQIT